MIHLRSNRLAIPIMLACLCAAAATTSFTQNKALGLLDGQTDIGTKTKPGSTRYDAAKDTYTITGAGTNMWGGDDEFHFVWKRLRGNFILTTGASFVGKGVEAHRKMGWTARASLDSNSPHVTAVVHGDGLTSLQFRRTPGATSEEVKSTLTSADVLQLERKGSTFILSAARSGEPFVTEEVSDITLGDEIYIGLFVCSHNKEVSETAVFHNLQITIPASPSFVPYRDYIGSNIETVDIGTGSRKTLYRFPESLQAPNWTPDGRALIYNSNGSLYRFDLATNRPERINTGSATNNNNDHVLSFDGKMIGISNHVKEDGNSSIVFTLPIGGGTPTRITKTGPSYLHGWSPDRKFLIYTGQRNGEFDIYKISSSGGDELRLTTAKGLDDGAEYTPDGKYIYFNSTRTGAMQIWRMKPDGSEQQQVTSDEYNNWFPHISPNGKWIVFLSFTKEVAPDDHPFYKHVYIRLMPADGGKAKVIAYVYGGQGTINVPSWSPDSRKVAFVSNSDMK